MTQVANTIYRGPVDREPQTLNRVVAAALLPGLFVKENGSDQFALATTAIGRLMLLANRRFYDQDLTTAYASGDTGVAYRLQPDDEFQAQFSAGTYAKGAELTVDANGRMAAAASTNIVVAFYDGDGATLANADLDDIVIANQYVKP